MILYIILIIIVIYIFYNIRQDASPKQNFCSARYNKSEKFEQSSKPLLEYNTLSFKNPIKNSIYNVDLLADPGYSKEKNDLVIDDNDEVYYREHLNDFMMEASKYNGLNSNRENVSVIPNDATIDNYAKFDKNEQGYFGSKNQNVHNSVIQKNVKEKYNNIEKKNNSTRIIYKNDILQYVNGNNIEKLDDILTQIEKRNSPISKLDDTEVNILNNTWANSNENVRKQIVNELLDLTDGKQYIVCPSGVSSRIINANVVDDPTNGPITESNLHEEMMNTASNIRSKLEEIDDFKLLDEETQSTILKKKLIAKFYDDYNGIISMEIIQNELDSWIDYI